MTATNSAKSTPTGRAFSPPMAGLLLGLAAAVADWLVLVFADPLRAPMPVTVLTVLVLAWTWMTAGSAAGLLFGWQRLGRIRALALTFAVPGVLLLSRAATPAKDALQVSSKWILLGWFLLVLLAAWPLSRLRFRPARHWGLWAAAIGLSVLGLFFSASGLRVRDLLPASGAEMPAPVKDGRRNVVLIFLDTMRYDAVEGPPASMPGLAAFARRSVFFESAWAPAAWTEPSHAAVLTGENPWSAKAVNHRYYPSSVPLARRFLDRGYATAAVFANGLLTTGTGFTEGFQEQTWSRGSEVCRSGIGNLLWRLYLNDAPRSPVCSSFSAPEITSRAQNFVRRRRRPYFVAVNYFDTHDPYYLLPECRQGSSPGIPRHQRETVLTSQPGRPAPAEWVRHANAQYRSVARCLDRSVAQLIATVTQDGNTVVAVVADHGEQFGEHGLGSHGNSVYAQLTHVPLLLHVPGEAPARVHEPVTITDLYETLWHAANPRQARAPLPLLDPRQRRPVIATFEELHPLSRRVEAAVAVVRGSHHFIRWRDGREVLFDYRADPAEEREIDPRLHPEVAGPMRELALKTVREQTARPEFDALGYIQ